MPFWSYFINSQSFLICAVIETRKVVKIHTERKSAHVRSSRISVVLLLLLLEVIFDVDDNDNDVMNEYGAGSSVDDVIDLVG